MDKHRGHEMRLDSGVWRYGDGVAVAKDADRPCGACGLANTPEGHDGCLGMLPEVMNACCGHGATPEAYVQLVSGERLAGVAALELFARYGRGPGG